ncbi:MAG: T9SS type A sorting domain-containing protein [Bacteroidales bacterium]
MRKLLLSTLLISFISLNSVYAVTSEFGVLGRLDSIVYELNDIAKVRKAVYEYTDKTLTGITVSESNSLNSTWTPVQRTVLSEVSGIQYSIQQIYNTNSQIFVNSTKSEISLDDKSNRTLEASYIWDDTSSAWKGFRSKLERTYIDSGVISTYAYSDWDSISNSWKIYSQGAITFTPFIKPESIIYSAPNLVEQLEPTSKIIASYLANNELEYETVYSYSASNGYTPVFRTHYEYSPSEPQYTETIENYSVGNSTWLPMQKTEKTFSLEGNMVRYMVADRDTVALAWKERFRHDFSILSTSSDSLNIVQADSPNGITLFTKKYKQINDANGLTNITNTTEGNGSLIEKQIQQITTTAGTLSQFKNTDDFEEVKMEWSFDSTSNKLQCLDYQINNSTNQIELLRKSTFSFNKNEVAVQTVKDGNLTFGPNPVSDVLRITNNTPNVLTFKILTLDGKPVIVGSSSDRCYSVQANGLQPGAYILQMTLGKNKSKSSLIIKK